MLVVALLFYPLMLTLISTRVIWVEMLALVLGSCNLLRSAAIPVTSFRFPPAQNRSFNQDLHSHLMA